MRSSTRKAAADDCEHEVVGQELAVGLNAEDRMVEPLEARLQDRRDLERAPVLAAGQVRELRGQHVEGVGDRQRHHGEEDRLHAQREEADRQRQRERQDEGADEPERQRPPARAEPVERQPDAIGADAEEHHVGEGHDAGVAEQDVVGGDQQDHDAGLGRRVQRLRAREQERREQQREHDERDQDLQRPAAGRIAGKKRHRPLTG